MSLTIASNASSGVSVGAIDNQFGTITTTATGSGTVATGNYECVTATYDASGTSSTVTANFSGVTGVTTFTGSSGLATLTTASGASSSTTLTLGASNGVSDVINLNATASRAITIANFEAGAGGDNVEINDAGVEAIATGTQLVSATNSATALTNQAVSFVDLTAATDLGSVSGHILRLGGNYATATLAADAIETGGARAITINGAFATSDAWLIMWDDGSDSYLGVADTANIVGDDALPTAADVTITTLVTFTGVTDVTTFVAANLGGSIN